MLQQQVIKQYWMNMIHFLEGRLLNAGEESYYDLPIRSDKSASLYEHCVKAIEHGLRFGEHGLPLIGSGDWNDGMDKVGEHGKGESVWLAFFLYDILIRFIEIAVLKNDEAFAEKCKQAGRTITKIILIKMPGMANGIAVLILMMAHHLVLQKMMNVRLIPLHKAGQYYQKQVIPNDHVQQCNLLINTWYEKKIGMIQLFDPPFDKSDLNPGYIKGYVPGVRENGGQYTHAAIWLVMAFAALGDKQKNLGIIANDQPFNHGNTEEKIDVYKVEPYVIAAMYMKSRCTKAVADGHGIPALQDGCIN